MKYFIQTAAFIIFLAGANIYAKPKMADPAAFEEAIAKSIKTLDAAKPKKERLLLVFSITNGYRHPSIPVGELALKMLGEQTGAYKAVVSNDLNNFEPDVIDKFDAICFMNTTLEVFSPNKKKAKGLSKGEKEEWATREVRLKESLLEFIAGGKGFIGIHAATDTFYKWPEYGEMIGGYFDGHPWNANTTVSIMPEEGQECHCCVAHLDGENLNFKEEIYQFKDPYDVTKLNVILRLDPEKNDLSIGKREDKDYPVSWVKPYEKGSVFYSSLGHNPEIFAHPQVLQHYLAGIQWAMGDLKTDR